MQLKDEVKYGQTLELQELSDAGDSVRISLPASLSMIVTLNGKREM